MCTAASGVTLLTWPDDVAASGVTYRRSIDEEARGVRSLHAPVRGPPQWSTVHRVVQSLWRDGQAIPVLRGWRARIHLRVGASCRALDPDTELGVPAQQLRHLRDLRRRCVLDRVARKFEEDVWEARRVLAQVKPL
jgi:hypothetical protein